MGKPLPITVSSKLTNVETTDRFLPVNPYANGGVTAEKAPLLLSVQAKRTMEAEEFASRMLSVGGQGTLAQARLVVNGIAGVMMDLVEEYGAITVQTPFGTVQTFIAGSVDSATAQPDPERNWPFLGVEVPEVYRRQFAQFEPYVATSDCPAALKRVRDKATNAKGICGTSPFYLEGRGMTFGEPGETLELLDPVTRDLICDVTVDEEQRGKSQFLCTLAPQTAVEAGVYLLKLVTLAGGEPGEALWPLELEVELLEAVPAPAPEPTRHVEFSALAATATEMGNANVLATVDDAEGVLGYTVGESDVSITAYASVDGGEEEELTLVAPPDGNAFGGIVMGVPQGSRVKVTLKIDPAKTDFDQTPISREATVAQG